MERTIYFLALSCSILGFVGCGKSVSRSSELATYFEFEVALRQTSVPETPDRIVETYNVISHHKVPVQLGRSNEAATSIAAGVWLDIKWDDSEIRDHRLWLHGLKYRIRNKLFYEGSGGGMGWGTVGGIGISSDWQHVSTRVKVSSAKDSPILYHRVRWMDPDPAIPDIEMTCSEGSADVAHLLVLHPDQGTEWHAHPLPAFANESLQAILESEADIDVREIGEFAPPIEAVRTKGVDYTLLEDQLILTEKKRYRIWDSPGIRSRLMKAVGLESGVQRLK